ncbi:MAG: ribonuclease III family protein [Thermoprotei archaeon]
MGDALLNTAATLHAVSMGEPRSIRVRNSVLSQAVKSLGLVRVGRHDTHKLADLYEGLVGYAYLRGKVKLEDLEEDISSDPGYARLLEHVLSELQGESED